MAGTNKSYSTPILAVIFRLLGGLTIGVAALGLVLSLSGENSRAVAFSMVPLLALVFSGLVQIGIGEVIDLIGRTAYYTRAASDTLTTELYQVRQKLIEIEGAARATAYHGERASNVLAGAEIDRS